MSLRSSASPPDGTEDADIGCPMAGSDPQDIFALLPKQCINAHHTLPMHKAPITRSIAQSGRHFEPRYECTLRQRGALEWAAGR
jgi:hypothetical protein